MTLAAFLGILAIHLVAAISPGPAFVVAIRTAASQGLRPATGLAVGLGAGATLWAVAALLGLALLFEVAPVLLTALKIGGAGFLLWLAVRTWRHARDPLPAPDTAPPQGMGAALRLGLLTQLANPKPAVFFGAVFVGLVPPDTPPAVLALIVGFILLNETLWFLLVGAVFSRPSPRALYGHAKRGIDRTFGALIAALSLRMLWTA